MGVKRVRIRPAGIFLACLASGFDLLEEGLRAHVCKLPSSFTTAEQV